MATTADSRRPRKARVTIDSEVWDATVGETLRQVGRYARKPGLGKTFIRELGQTSSATVERIDADSRTIYTDGKGGQWARVAQVHQLEVIEYFED